MPLLEQPNTHMFETATSTTPLHVADPTQQFTQTPAPAMDTVFSPPAQDNGFQQGQMQPQMQPMDFQQAQAQPPFQPDQTQFMSAPQGQVPVEQQPYQGMSQMTPQQVKHVQQVLQQLPPEKLQMVQQQVQQQIIPSQQQQQMMLPQQQQMMPPQQMMLPQQQQMVFPPQGMVMSPQPILQPSPPVGHTPHYTQTAPSGLFGSKHSSGHGHGSGPQDAQKSDTVKRFFGDTLFGRVARSSVQTATSMAKMPTSLSPWGDNNPVTLPNVRYRDAVLFTTFAFVGGPLVEGAADGITSTFGADSFISEIVNSGAGAIAASTVLKYSVFQIVEQAIDKGIIEHMLPEEERMLVTTNVKSLQVGIKHKLMGVDADLRFYGIYPARDSQACEKGWFCPYLFASARTPSVPRANDFAIAQSFGPFLGGDYLLAHKLLSESVHTLALCEANPTIDIGTNRMLILFTGLAPFRANMWSTSRRPGCGTVVFHLLDGCPALVVPVTKNAPITAWSPWTLSQMRVAQCSMNGIGNTNGMMPVVGSGGYSPEWQHEQICEWLDTIISVPHINPALQARYIEVLSRSVSLVINGALALQHCTPLLGKLDPERAGICMFRY